jgi:hypothetical protein
LKYLFDEDTGLMTKGRDGKPESRIDACPPPCQTDRGCPKGTPQTSRALNYENQRCYEHYSECRAVGVFPDDPVVRRNAAIIRGIEDEAVRQEKRELRETLVQLIVGK